MTTSPFAVIPEEMAEAWPALGNWFSGLLSLDKPPPGHLALLQAAGFSPGSATFLTDPVDRNVLVAQMVQDGAVVVALPVALIEAEAALDRIEVSPAVDFGIWRDETGIWWPLPAPPASGRHQFQAPRNLDRLDDILLTLLLSPTAEPASHASREPEHSNMRAYLAARPDELWRADRAELEKAIRG